ncbi:MAG: hypothetical protein DYG89_43125 [Caldilinea sp. CFX5]|nr:hypothetical protein [Caldilinea sp. CFX5]
MEWDYARPWYHGSPLELTVLLPGSTITQDRDLARVFSHKPTIVAQDVNDQGERVIKHTGQAPGFLYRIAETVNPADVLPHPQTTMGPGQEWLINRALPVALIEPTQVITNEKLSDEEIAALRAKGG